MTKKNKGFTLIELLVVVAILGLLATIVAVSLTSARARARDARRVSDIRQTELALELYYAAHEQYPDSSTSTADGLEALIDQGYLNMTDFPKDPNTGNYYCYAVGTDSSLASGRQRQYYHIGAVLENTSSDMLGDDLDYESVSTGTITWSLNSGNDCFVGTTDGFQGDETVTGAEGTYDRGVTP